MRLINITEYLDRTVELFPDRIAASQEERALTFREVHNLALSLASKISQALAGQTRQIVAVFLPKSPESLVADLAILYSGNAYMNLDVNNPRARLDAIIQKTVPALLLGSADTHLNVARQIVVDLKALPALDQTEKDAVLALRRQLIDSDLLCLINTSGSTGTPKAVALTHRGFIDFTEAVRETGMVAENEIVGSLSPVIFDIWSFELCMMMAFASRIVCLAGSDAAFPARLLTRLAEAHVSFIFWVPTIMVMIANQKLLDEIPLPELRMIWFAGEVFPTVKYNYWRARLPEATFANFYGPIEITLDCLYYVADRPLTDDEPMPIGRPFPNTRVILLDENNQEVTPQETGREGEICVAGSSLATGYYNDPEKTAQAFTLNPLETAFPEIIYRTGDLGYWNGNGEVMFSGRRDAMIKHRGYRIELGEIEHVVLAGRKDLTNCCALYDGEKIVLAYEAPAKLDEKALYKELLRLLPHYMAPQAYWHFTELPRNPNGKIDRNYLKEGWSRGAIRK